MNADDVLGQLDQKQRQRAIVIHNAVVKCTKAYNSDSTAANLRDLKAAEAEWDRIVAEVVSENKIEIADNQTDDHFSNRLEAWQYLQDSGWQIGRSQFYEHCKQGRLPRKDGRYLRADVDRYAQNHCRLAETGEKVNDKLARMAEEKAETELAREKARLEKELMALAINRGEFVPRDEVEQMIVGRAVALLAHLRAMVQMSASDLIALVGGDQKYQRELIGALNEKIEEYVAVFAKDIEFEIIFEKNIKGDEV